MYELFNNIDRIFVINLKKDSYRRDHITKEFKKFNLNFEIIDAVSFNDEIVKEFYIEDRVMAYPPCFRCFEDSCDHDNNYLTPKQVANFLSIKNIMEKILKENLKNTLIFEDDFKFTFHSRKSFKNLTNFLSKKNLLNYQNPFLFRIGSHTVVNKKYYLKLLLLRKNTFIKNNFENMANPCFLVNHQFADLFLQKFDYINTTSDNFIHRKLAEENNVLNFSIYPFPVTQLSYGRKKNLFKSSITSDQENYNFTNLNKIKNQDEYLKLKEDWLSS